MNYRPMGMGEKKKLILMNKHNYVGREYIKAFSKTNLSFDVARIGNYPLKDKLEDLRCGGKWIPPNEDSFEYKIHDFKSLIQRSLICF